MTRVPNRFVGLHAHDGGSSYDGLSSADQHIDFARENGMDALAITNHGHCNTFPIGREHQMKLAAKGIEFKFIPGVEAYFHPNLNDWSKELELSKKAKDDAKLEEKRRKEAKEKLVTPLEVSTDGDGEVIDVTNALTIENEDETKSNKFFNPVNRRHHLVILPKNSAGLLKVFHLVSRGYLEGFYRFPRIDYSMLKEAAKDRNIMVSTACLGGQFSYLTLKAAQGVPFDELSPDILNDRGMLKRLVFEMENEYEHLVDAVGAENVMLELQFNRLPAQHLVNRAMLELVRKNNLQKQLIVTADSHYARPEHWKEREIYKKLGWLNYTEINPDALPKSRDELKCELYPKNADQIWQEYQSAKDKGHTFYDDDEVCDAIERTHDIAHQVIGEVQYDCKIKLPAFAVPEGKTAMRALMDECKAGMKLRGLSGKPDYVARLKEELEIIRDMGFELYFLTLKIIMDIAREEMLLGPGRGSGAGSLVNYVLCITDVDPLKWDLLFSRFLNRDRAEAPDIDSDVGNRDRLIEMLRERLGNENVIPISNINTFALKTLVKDVSRFYGIPYDEANAATKTVDEDVKKAVLKHGMDKNLFTLKYEDAMEHSPSFKEFIDRHPEVSEPIAVLFKQQKALGRHAGGVLVTDRIAERMPLVTSKGEPQSPWCEGLLRKDLGVLGWVKFDLLGLETLRIIQRTIELILQRHEGVKYPTFAQVRKWYDEKLSPDVIDFDDQKVYENVYHSGKWCGVFQFTESGAQRLCKRGKPTSIIDIAALTSIYRPGPLAADVDKLYLGAKAEPEKIKYVHPLVKQVLEETYGCVIFQESVMEVCHHVAGFPRPECDKVRKAIMKRSISGADEAKKKIIELKAKFIKGCVERGLTESDADQLFETLAYFSGYGFNKSHAISYAIDSYWCAWLMTYYEAEWLCAYLESMSGNPDSRAKAFGEAKALGYSIVPIDVNYAKQGWTILDGKRFMPSMSSCKGVGDIALDEIEKCRPYSSIYEMLWNDDGSWRPSKFNRKALESLIKIRAFDSFDIVGEGKLFESYKQMYTVLIDNSNEIKKSGKTDPYRGRKAFDDLLKTTRGMGEWTKQELVHFSGELLGALDVDLLVPPEMQERLLAKGVKPVNDWDKKDIYWGIVTEVTPKKTRNKKNYLLLKIVGTNGKVAKLFCWGWDGVREIKPLTPIMVEIDRGDFGYSTNMWRVKELNT